MKKLLLITFASLIFINTAIAEGITLNWTANSEQDLAGYVVYCGPSTTAAELTQLAVINDKLSVSWSDPTFFDGKPFDTMYYCALKAFNTSDQFSPFSAVSNGVFVASPATPPAAPTGLSVVVTSTGN